MNLPKIRTPNARCSAEPRADAPARVAYILAASHSGSTLLAMLLGAQREVCTVGELQFGFVHRPEYLCSCGELVTACAFWRRTAEEMGRRGTPFDITRPGTDFARADQGYVKRLLAPLHRGPILELVRDTVLAVSADWRRELEHIQRTNAALIRSISSVTGKPIVVDSSKGALRLKFLLRNPDLDVKVIRLLRDGRAVALTYMDMSYAGIDPSYARTTNKKFRSKNTLSLSIELASHNWMRANTAADCLLASLSPNRALTIRYEDYCDAPRRVLTDVLRFLGADFESIDLDYRSGAHHVLGNAMRFDETKEIVRDERWRGVLSRDQLRTFDRISGALNRSYGYEQ